MQGPEVSGAPERVATEILPTPRSTHRLMPLVRTPLREGRARVGRVGKVEKQDSPVPPAAPAEHARAAQAAVALAEHVRAAQAAVALAERERAALVGAAQAVHTRVAQGEWRVLAVVAVRAEPLARAEPPNRLTRFGSAPAFLRAARGRWMSSALAPTALSINEATVRAAGEHGRRSPQPAR